MDTTIRTAFRPWPAQVELRHASDRQVVGVDGTRLDLEAFRDACRARAADLREQAIAEAGPSLRAMLANAIQVMERRARHGRAVASRGGF